MSNAVVPLNKINLPAHLRADADQARTAAAEYAGGVTASFPIISYRGKVWRIKKAGEEVAYLDRKGNPIPSVDVVLVRSNPRPSKTYYAGKYTEGDTAPPTCWSSDGLKPDVGVQQKQHHVCATCPRNAWGSRMTEAGKKGRECSDVRRMAVVFYSELQKKGADAHLFLMRVPPASLNPLKDYVEKALAPANVMPHAVVTQMGFDTQAAHPKITFRVAEDENDNAIFLDEEEYELIKQLRESDDVHRILSEEPDYAEAGTTGGDEGTARAAEGTSAPASAPKPPKAQRARPVDEEDVPTTSTAPADPGDEDQDEDEESAAADAAAAAAAAAAEAAAAKAKAAKAAMPQRQPRPRRLPQPCPPRLPRTQTMMTRPPVPLSPPPRVRVGSTTSSTAC